MQEFKDISTSSLKEQYIACCLAAMVYGTKTEQKRKELSKEIERREKVGESDE